MTNARGKAWTDLEMGIIADTLDEPAIVVADFLDRPRATIYRARARLRDGWTPVKLEWTDDDLAVLRATSDLPLRTVAEMLGRTETAVEQHRSTLGIKFTGTRWQQLLPCNTRGRTLLAQTCTECGLLLDATWFQQVAKNRSWRSVCTRCVGNSEPVRAARLRYEAKKKSGQSDAQRRAYNAKQELTIQTATRHREPYTEADHKVLANPKLTALTKALRLRRTYAAVCVQLSINGYSSKVGLGDPADGQWKISFPESAA